MSKHHAARRSVRAPAPTPVRSRPLTAAIAAAPALIGKAAMPASAVMERDQPVGAEPTPAERATAAAEAAQAALRSLRAVAPTLHERQNRDLYEEVQRTLRLAQLRQQALDTGNAYTGLGTPAPDPSSLSGNAFAPDFLRAATGPTSGSPTGSVPLGSSPSGYLGGWAGTKDQPKGVLNAQVLRNFSRDPWVFAAIKHLADRIARADIDVLPLDTTKPLASWQQEVQRRVRRLLASPNEKRDSYTSMMKRVVHDLMVLDRGCISKGMQSATKRVPTGLYDEDGATIKIYANWAGDPRTPRYLYEEPGGTKKVPLRNDELICVMENETTYSFGLSRVQVLLNDIDADVKATQSAIEYQEHKPPPTLIQIPGSAQQQLDDLRNTYESTIAGKRQALFLAGEQPAQVHQLVWSNRDQQWMEWQNYLARKICAVIGVSPQSLGMTFDVNKATADSQMQIEDDAGLIPILLLLEDYFNRELLWDFAPPHKDDGRPDFEALNLGIFFPEISEASRILHVERLISIGEAGLAGLPFITPNEVRAMLGEEPVAGGNTLWAPTAQGPLPWLTYDRELGDFGGYYLGGMLGAQEPGGGPAESGERDLDDTTSAKADRSNPNANANANANAAPGAPQAAGKPAAQNSQTPGSDESSGRGSTPNIPTDDSTTTDGKAWSGWSEAWTRRSVPAVPTSMTRQRRPGQRWRPTSREAERPLAQYAAAAYGGGSFADPYGLLLRSATLGMMASPFAALLAAQQQGQYAQQSHGASVSPAVSADGIGGMWTAPMAQAMSRAVEQQLLRFAAPPPQRAGRVSPTTAQSHHRPPEEHQARGELRQAVRQVHETAAQRGAQTMRDASQAASRSALLAQMPGLADALAGSSGIAFSGTAGTGDGSS